MIRIALLLFALCAIPAAARAQAEAPDAEEYAVLAAVLDSMMPGSEHVRLLDTTIVIASLVRGSVLAMDGSRDPRLDSVAVDDFLRRNRVGARLEARFPARRPVVLVRGPEGDDWDRVANRPHLVVLSRPGFDARRRRAIVMTAMTCGDLCGEGSVFELERGSGGWKVVRMETTYNS